MVAWSKLRKHESRSCNLYTGKNEFFPRDAGISEIRAERCPVEPLDFAQLQNKQKIEIWHLEAMKYSNHSLPGGFEW